MRFSLVYPTFNRPQFIEQGLRVLRSQQYDDFEVIVSDSCIDPAKSSEQICRDSGLANVVYVRPPHPVGMVENWNYGLAATTGEYVCYMTDKMFMLPDALANIDRALRSARDPDIVGWVSDAYAPSRYPDYFGDGQYLSVASDVRSGAYEFFSPSGDLDYRGSAPVARTEQSSSRYSRGKIVFGGYHRDLVDRIVRKYGALFHNISPDYTSMVLALSEARTAIEMAASCVVAIYTDLSNGALTNSNDIAALWFMNSLVGGAEELLPTLPVPGLYTSQHNSVAHDFMSLKQRFDLLFTFDLANWVVYSSEDINRSDRIWSSPEVEAEQKGCLRSFMETVDLSVATAIRDRIAARGR